MANGAEKGFLGSRGTKDATETEAAQPSRIFVSERNTAPIVTTFQHFWVSATNLWRLDSGDVGVGTWICGAWCFIRSGLVGVLCDLSLFLLLADRFLERPTNQTYPFYGHAKR